MSGRKDPTCAHQTYRIKKKAEQDYDMTQLGNRHQIKSSVKLKQDRLILYWHKASQGAYTMK